MDERNISSTQQCMLMHLEQLNSLFDSLLCPECFEDHLCVSIGHGECQGFATKLFLKCTKCKFQKSVMSSPRSRYANIPYSDATMPFDINKRMVMFSHEIGSSHSALDKFSAVVGIPNMHLKTYQRHNDRFVTVETVQGQHALQRAAEQVRQAYADTDQDYADRIQHGLGTTGEPLDITVSFDGTWQKRGFTSLYGVGVVIEVTTGLVVDFEVLSKYCHACKMAESRNMSEDDLAEWRLLHKSECSINFEKSSKAMESEAAHRLWCRSVQKHNFRYTQMLSDGDSAAFKAVKDSHCYGDVVIEKLECINHAHKRMGTALRKLTKEERLGGRGKGRLTEAKCKDLQNFYRGAILDHQDSAEDMRNAIWSALWHSMSSDEEPHHQQCPKGVESWCFYQKALALGESPPRHSDHPASTHLSKDVAHRLIPVYRRMSDAALLTRMRHGKTQNCNESFNNLIWMTVPKTLFFGKARIDAAVARAVLKFNEGAEALTLVMNRLHVELSQVTVNSLQQTDRRRVAKADQRCQADEVKRRKVRAGEKFRHRLTEEAEGAAAYGGGMF